MLTSVARDCRRRRRRRSRRRRRDYHRNHRRRRLTAAAEAPTTPAGAGFAWFRPLTFSARPLTSLPLNWAIAASPSSHAGHFDPEAKSRVIAPLSRSSHDAR